MVAGVIQFLYQVLEHIHMKGPSIRGHIIYVCTYVAKLEFNIKTENEQYHTNIISNFENVTLLRIY